MTELGLFEASYTGRDTTLDLEKVAFLNTTATRSLAENKTSSVCGVQGYRSFPGIFPAAAGIRWRSTNANSRRALVTEGQAAGFGGNFGGIHPS